MDYLSLLPAELQWEIYLRCWERSISEVHQELLRKVDLACSDPLAGLLCNYGNRWWRPAYHRDHHSDWGLWRDGAARLYLCTDGNLICGPHIYRYRNLFSRHERYCSTFRGKYKVEPECRVLCPPSGAVV